ncbi:MAG: hypothetical protein KDC98_22640, partial [Planctomycetes bacterium]|nr:hypothetical protein [Planctomycetota bacterium]
TTIAARVRGVIDSLPRPVDPQVWDGLWAEMRALLAPGQLTEARARAWLERFGRSGLRPRVPVVPTLIALSPVFVLADELASVRRVLADTHRAIAFLEQDAGQADAACAQYLDLLRREHRPTDYVSELRAEYADESRPLITVARAMTELMQCYVWAKEGNAVAARQLFDAVDRVPLVEDTVPGPLLEPLLEQLGGLMGR